VTAYAASVAVNTLNNLAIIYREDVHWSIFRRSTQISHARRAGEPSLLKYGAMLSGDIMGDLGESKGVAAVAAGSASTQLHKRLVRYMTTRAAESAKHP
jgi:hypothetical protein